MSDVPGAPSPLTDPVPDTVVGTVPGLRRTLLAGAGALGVATFFQRALTFGANLLGARVAGPATFGEYSLAIATAAMIAGYASVGAGTVATRFAGQYPRTSPAYRAVLRTVLLYGIATSILAFAVLALGAGIAARTIVDDPAMESLLRIAALASAASVLFQMLSGLALGLLEFRGL